MRKRDAIMIIGKTNIDYFVILCEKCGSTTKNQYLGTDPMMPRFKATCPKCGDLGAFKLDAIDWSGLPPEPSTS
jgi:predicted nucleic-acid-binding Zn-ribbon protein